MTGSTIRIQKDLNSPNDQNRRDALFEIVETKRTELAEDVLQLMHKELNNEIKGRCAFALGRLNHKEAYPYLVHNLRHPSPEVRKWSAWALGKMMLTRAEKHLRKTLEAEKDEYVGRAVGGAIKRLSGEPVRMQKNQVHRELSALRLPFTDNRNIRETADQLEKLTWPEHREEILQLRSMMLKMDPIYYRAYVKYASRRPVLLKSLDDDEMVYS